LEKLSVDPQAEAYKAFYEDKKTNIGGQLQAPCGMILAVNCIVL
jgi:hypothetical protein